jgi:hypothetical protein
MNRRLNTVILFLVSFTTAYAEFRSQQAQNRELPGYDDGGAFNFAWELAPQHEQMRARLRDFIWQHWREKRLSRVTAIFHSIEGDPTTYNFYIEPDNEGRWRIRSQYETECCWFYAMEKKKRKRKLKKAVDVYDLVVRVKNTNSGGAEQNEIADSDRSSPTEYRLRLGRRVKRGNPVDFFFL